MKRVRLMALMSQECGHAKAEYVGCYRNTVGLKELERLITLKSRYRGEDVKELGRQAAVV